MLTKYSTGIDTHITHILEIGELRSMNISLDILIALDFTCIELCIEKSENLLSPEEILPLLEISISEKSLGIFIFFDLCHKIIPYLLSGIIFHRFSSSICGCEFDLIETRVERLEILAVFTITHDEIVSETMFIIPILPSFSSRDIRISKLCLM